MYQWEEEAIYYILHTVVYVVGIRGRSSRDLLAFPVHGPSDSAKRCPSFLGRRRPRSPRMAAAARRRPPGRTRRRLQVWALVVLCYTNRTR